MTVQKEPRDLAQKSHGPAITYNTMIRDHRPLKKKKWCRLVVGGDYLAYSHEIAAPAANLLESKMIFNGSISTP